jgi:hypothetical protein
MDLQDLIDHKIYIPLTYALSLEDDCWYVGFSTQLNTRLAQHIQGTASKWTTLHPMKELVEVRLGNCEKDLTLQYMEAYGWESVRGYSWCSPDLDKPPVPLRKLRPAKVL